MKGEIKKCRTKPKMEEKKEYRKIWKREKKHKGKRK